MSREGEIKNIYRGLTTDVFLNQAKSFKIFERRRITIAVHQSPDSEAAPMFGMLKVYGAVKDEITWFVELGTINLNASTEKTSHFNYANSISSGSAILYLRCSIEGLDAGKIDVIMHQVEE